LIVKDFLQMVDEDDYTLYKEILVKEGNLYYPSIIYIDESGFPVVTKEYDRD